MTTRTGCNIPDEDPLNQTVGDCSINPPAAVAGCPIDSDITSCIPDPSCELWQLTESPETCLIASYIDESLNIGGANINVFKLLGVHEQGLLTDLSGQGAPLASGSHPNFPALNAFDKYLTEWHSLQTGTDVTGSGYLGYDFGPIRLNNDRVRYGVETYLKQEISTIKIKQGCEAVNRVTKARIERSPDGVKWYGVDQITLPDCDGLVTVSFKGSVPSRFWRIRPTAFNGGQSDPWVVQALQLLNYEATTVTNIQDRIFLENRDRDYSDTSVAMKASYIPVDIVANAERFGFIGQESYILQTSFMATLAKLGRPFVIGDIIEMPSEMQFSTSLRKVLKYVEVQDVAWSTTGYSPTWVPLMQRLICKPALASQETQQIFGKLTPDTDNSGLVDINNGQALKYQDYSAISQNVEAAANTMKPEDGTDFANIEKLSPELIAYGASKGKDMRRLDRHRGVYGIDAMPPNGLPFTEGDAFPPMPKNADYHRMIYPGKNIPARLYRFSTMKKGWILLESDQRFKMRDSKTRLEEYKSPNADDISISITKVDKTLEDEL